MSMLIHLLSLLTGFIGGIILWLLKKDESKFVDFHGRESLNFMISITIYGRALSVLALVIGVLTFGIGGVLVMPLMLAFSIGALIIEIKACIAANRGEYYSCPLTIRLIPTVK